MEQYGLKDGSILVIGSSCLQSYPCQHDCKINDNSVRYSGDDICKIFIKNDIPIPKYYKCYIKNDYIK